VAQDLPQLDENIVMLPEDIREDLAERGRNDLYFFAKAILGYSDMSVSCHGPLCMFLTDHPSRFKLVLMPRGHFKTSVATISGTLQRTVRDPNSRQLMANETSTNAERFLNAIRQHAEANKVFRALYSDIIPKDTRKSRWSNQELQFVRQWMGPEPSIDTMGMTGAMTSRHYTHITVDDPISEEAVKSASVMQDVITRIDKLFSLMVKPDSDTFHLIGTRWAFYDVYEFFIRQFNDHLAKFVRGAIEDGQPIFPELISLETLAQARASMGEYSFSCLYMNNPRNVELQDFNVEDLRFWRWATDEEGIILYDRQGQISKEVPLSSLDITVAVDPSPAETVGSDPNAIVTTGVTPNGEVIVLDAWSKRCTPLEVIEKMFELKRRFSPRAFGIEDVVYQKALKYFVKAECARRNTYMNVVPLKSSGRRGRTNKGVSGEKLHIRALQPLCATGRLYILPTMHEMRNQLADYPLGKHDDVIDALAMQVQMWHGVMSEERLAKYKRSERELISRMRARQGGQKPTTRAQLLSTIPRRARDPRDIPHPDDLGLYDLVTDTWEEVTFN